MLYNRKLDRLLLLIVPAALIVYASTRPQLSLRVNMPPEFIDISQSASRSRREAENQLAQQYWDCVLTTIQWKYTYGSLLPDAPPEGFRVEKSAVPGSESVASSRVRYWRQLRKVWVMPSSWTTSRNWSFNWLIDPLKRAADWVNNYFSNLFSRG
jgi:hypothetical protein